MSSTQEVGDIFGQGKGSAQAMLRSPTVLILCVGLWGMNLFFYRLFGIDYKYILNYDLIEIDKEEKEKATRQRLRKRSDGYTETATANNVEHNNIQHDLELVEMDIGSSKIINNKVMPETATRRPHSPDKLLSPIITIPMGKARSSPQDGINGDTTTTTSSSSILPILPQLPPSPPDVGTSIHWYKLVLFSVVLLLLLHTSTHYWMDHLHRSSIGAVGFFYLSTVVYIFVPLRQNSWLRRSFGVVVQRVWALIHPRCYTHFIENAGTVIPPRRVPFVDVFFADAMCSLSKVFFDWGMLAHQAVHYPLPVPAATHNIVVPSLCAAFPYLIRARQCLVMHTVGKLNRDPKRYQHLMNAFKYSTSMYPLILSAYLKTFPPNVSLVVMERTLIVLLIINASYSLYWDIVMDWGMMQDPYKVAQTACAIGVPSVMAMTLESEGGHDYSQHRPSSSRSSSKLKGHHQYTSSAYPSHKNLTTLNASRQGACHQVCLRSSLRFGLTMTVLIVVADSFLRFSWCLKFVPKLFPSNNSFVLCTQFLEVFRRAIWNLLRVEWEHIKQQKHAQRSNESLDSEQQNQLQQQQQQQAQLSQGLIIAGSSVSSLGSIGGGDQEDHKKESSLEMKTLR
jgi:hypothetical protein